MSPAIDHLLKQVKAYHAELVPTGPDSLKVRAPAPLPADFMNELRQHKAELLSVLGMPRPYRFTLRAGEGAGVYRSTAPNLETAREELRKLYGDRLLLVTAHGCAA